MREPARDAGRLQDIIEAAHYIQDFMDGLQGADDFNADKLRYFAILKNVEIIGEAAYMLSTEFKDTHPEIPWNDIIRMRHVLVHGYASVLPELLWVTASREVPVLREQVRAILQPESNSPGE